MNPDSETVLSILDGSSELERLVVVLCTAAAGTCIELRQESWGEGVGWFTQSRVTLEPHQVGQLRATLGVSSQPRRPALPAAFERAAKPSAAWCPRVVHADSA